MAQIICDKVSLGYEGRIFAENISFKVEEGGYLCIVGENGAGKSTLIKAIAGLKSPICGEIALDDGVRREDIGYLPQQTEVQRDFPASVREIVLSGCLNKCKHMPFYTKKERKKAEENMKKLGVFKLGKRCYRDLSGGQQQRVLLARALCSAEKMILLDEPAAGLDPVAMQEMYEIISELNKREGMTVVMVSHDIDAAVRYAKHILHIGNEPLFFGTAEDYAKSDVGRAFLGRGKESEI